MVDTITVRRATHTAGGFKFTGLSKPASVERILANARGGAPQVAVWFPGNGITYFSLNSGWGEKPVKNWAIEASDLARLREAAKTLGYKIKPSDSTPSAKRKGARRPKNEPPEFRRQLHMFDKGAS